MTDRGPDEVAPNAPGQRALRYVVTTHAETLAALVDAAPTELLRVPGEGAERPLAGLDLSPGAGLQVGLLSAWATIADVLAFYQERLVNEAYLGTAQETESVRLLLASAGYAPQAPVGASSWLAWTLSKSTADQGAVTLPAGSSVRSVPPSGQLPQTFETVRAVEARYAWNALEVAAPAPPPPALVDLSAASVVLSGRGLRLSVGAYVSVVGNEVGPDGKPTSKTAWGLVQITSSRENAAQGTTTVGWKVLHASSGDQVASPALSVFRVAGSLFGATARPWAKVPVAKQVQTKGAQPVGGAWQLPSPSGSWVAAQKGLPTAPLTAFARAADGTLYAGTAGGGVYATKDAGATWSAASQGMTRKTVYSLCAHPTVGLLAGTGAGSVFRSVDQGTTWQLVAGGSVVLEVQPTPVKSAILGKKTTKTYPQYKAKNTRLPNATIRALAVRSKGTTTWLVAGSDSGVWVSEDLGGTWTEANDGLPGYDAKSGTASVTVWSLAPDPKSPDVVWAGTSAGLWKGTLTPGGTPSWTQQSVLSPKGAPSVTAVLVTSDGTVLAGTSGAGLRRGTELVVGVPATAKVTCLAQGPAGALGPTLVASTDAGVYSSSGAGDVWADASWPTAGPVLAAVPLSGSGILAAAPVTGVTPKGHWPKFHPTGGTLEFSKVQASVAPKSSVGVYQADGATPAALYQASSVDVASKDQWGLRARVTSVGLDPSSPSDPQGIADYDLRSTVALGASAPLSLQPRELGPEDVVHGDAITLAGASLPAMEAGRPILVGGVPLQVCIAGTWRPLVRLVRNPGRKLGDSDVHVVWVSDAGQSEADRSSLQTPIRTTPGDRIVWRPATVAGWTPGDSTAVLTLQAALPCALSAKTVTVLGNVTEVGQGATRTSVVLGSGDHRSVSQTFAVPGAPLTSTRTPEAPDGLALDLEVSVDGLPWTPVRTLYGSGPDARVYTVLDRSLAERSDVTGLAAVAVPPTASPQGQLWVRFGDGVHGARLPSGTHNVTATLRVGAGSAGNVLANTLTLATQRQLGVQKVTNPLAATGGVDRESVAHARVHAPQRARPTGRVVSLNDHVDFVAGYAGVGKSGAWTVSTPKGRVVVVAIGDTEGAPIPPDSVLWDELTLALRAEAAPGLAGGGGMVVRTFRPIFFAVTAVLEPSRPHLDAKAQKALLASARAALSEAFGYPRRAFAQPVQAAQVVRTLQRVSGVAGVRIDRLARADAPTASGVPARLDAEAPAWSRVAQAVVGPQLLLVGTDRDDVLLSLGTLR